MPLWRQLLSVILLPGTVTILVPAAIIASGGETRTGWGLPAPFNLLPTGAGLLLIGLGLALMYQTIALFGTRGQGTLAPWDPPRRLVVRGIYRYVRNPMISGVFCILLGESILLGSRPLLYWWLIVVVVNLTYIPLLEEPGLARRFGADYQLYRQHVPRWVPRLSPWQPPWDD
jgi:protein-S-isoprenylcysteine O-methyltransferase Ste14